MDTHTSEHKLELSLVNAVSTLLSFLIYFCILATRCPSEVSRNQTFYANIDGVESEGTTRWLPNTAAIFDVKDKADSYTSARRR